MHAAPLVADLARAENLPREGGRIAQQVEFLSTHGSFVFRTPANVYKVKRPKNYGFLDYTTLESRRHFCDEEVALNRRFAPDVYLGVMPVFRDAAGHSLTRPGEVVDWAVHMRTLPDEQSALSLLRAGALGHEQLDEVVAWLARFYRQASPVTVLRDGESPAAAFRRSVEENFEQAAPFAGRFLEPARLARTGQRQRDWLATRAGLLARRTARDGHGDLRLEHVYLTPQGPLIIDCIEFLDRFRVADPALDVAFLAMDLRRQERPDLAEHLLARFALQTGDYGFWPLADGYVSYRAMVRAKVALFVAADSSTAPATAARKAAEASALLALAERSLGTPAERPTLANPPFTQAATLIAVGGMIASGKTTVAEALGRRIAAPAVSADATRKDLAGIGHEVRGGRELYTADWNSRVHAEILRRAAAVLESGRSAIIDTTFARRELRERARSLALRSSARFLFVECRVPESVARQRLAARTGGLSDAREDLLDSFLAHWEAVDELARSEHVVLDTTQPPVVLLGSLPAL